MSQEGGCYEEEGSSLNNEENDPREFLDQMSSEPLGSNRPIKTSGTTNRLKIGGEEQL